MGGGNSKKKAPTNAGGGGAPVGVGGAPPVQDYGADDNDLVRDAREALRDPALTAKYSCPDRQPLGCGAYASVWRVIDNNDQTSWALKIIDKSHGKCDEKEMIAVRWEAEALNICDHPNVTHLRETFETSSGGKKGKGFYFLVMEVMDGGELFDRIIERQHYSEADARDAVKTMCAALLHCHKSGVVHLDMKPENVLYAGKEGAPNANVMKLCDFGISKSTKVGTPGVMSNGMIEPDGHLHGTPSYLAPEMIRRSPYGPKADVWAIGVMTYILLGGIPPFDEPPVSSVIIIYFG